MDSWRDGTRRAASVLQHSNTPTLQYSVSSSYSSDKTILMWQLRLRIGPAEPRALGVKRRNLEAVCATASLICSRSVARPLYSFLCVLRSSAFAMADLSVLATNREPLRGTTASTACARCAGRPWICRTTSRIFCADILTFRVMAKTSMLIREWNDGIMEYWGRAPRTPSFQDSNLPLFHHSVCSSWLFRFGFRG